MTEKLILTSAQFRCWAETYSLGEPIEHDGRLWKCTSICYPALDRFGYSPSPLLLAGEVVPEEIWPEQSFGHGRPGARGKRTRAGNAKKGRPYVYTGIALLAAQNCGHSTAHSPEGSNAHYYEWVRVGGRIVKRQVE